MGHFAYISKDVASNVLMTVYDLFQVTNLMHNSFILYQYICYITILNMFRAVTCSSSGGLHLNFSTPCR